MTGVSIPLDEDPLPPGVTGPIGLFKLPVAVAAPATDAPEVTPPDCPPLCGLCNGVATFCTCASRGRVVVNTGPLAVPADNGGRAGFGTLGVVGVDGVTLPSGLDIGMNVVAAAVLTICGVCRIKFW